MNKKEINRRKFLKVLGAGSVATTAVMVGCKPGKKAEPGAIVSIGEVPTDKMTYRTNQITGDKVSLLEIGRASCRERV